MRTTKRCAKFQRPHKAKTIAIASPLIAIAPNKSAYGAGDTVTLTVSFAPFDAGKRTDSPSEAR